MGGLMVQLPPTGGNAHRQPAQQYCGCGCGGILQTEPPGLPAEARGSVVQECSPAEKLERWLDQDDELSVLYWLWLAGLALLACVKVLLWR